MIYVIFIKKDGFTLEPIGASPNQKKALDAWNNARLALLSLYRKKRDKWEAANPGRKNRTYRKCVKNLKEEDPKKLDNYPYAQPVLKIVAEL